MGQGTSAADWRRTVVTKFYELRYSYGLLVQSSTFLGCVGTWDYERAILGEDFFARGKDTFARGESRVGVWRVLW